MINGKLPKDSAGKILVNNIPTAFEQESIKKIKENFLKKISSFESINYIYILDQEEKLVGVVSIKDILSSFEEIPVSNIMTKNIVFARPSTDREKVALAALKNNLKSIPIVNKNNKFLGIVTSDVILDTLYKEATEDILLAGGISFHDSIKNLSTASALELFKARIPWLLIGLTGGILAAHIIGIFESTLKSLISLAFFIPIIVYLSDAVSTQSATIFIRGMAINNNLSIKKYFLRELGVGCFLGIVLGTILSIISYLGWQDLRLTIVLFLSVFLGVMFSVFFAIVIPVIFFKLKKDPAVATNPLATILSDVLSVTIYLLIAKALLSYIN